MNVIFQGVLVSGQSVDIKDEGNDVEISDQLDSKEESEETKPDFKGGVHVSTKK